MPMTEKQQTAMMVANAIADRLGLARQLGQTAYEGDRDYYLVLGYPTAISYYDYLTRYERQDVASRIVDLPAKDTWKKSPKISEEDNDDTPFAQAWKTLDDRLGVFSVLTRADRLSGIGRYGVVLIGFRSSSQEEGALPVDNPLAQPVEPGSLTGPEDVLYLRPYSEDRAKIKDWVEDPNDPRYGFPLTYDIKITQDKDPVTVHWSRVLHLADGKLDSEVYGTPRLRTVFNRLDDLIKIVGGTAEATWLNMRPGIMIGPKEGYDWEDTTDAETEWLEEVRRYAHDPLRMLRLVGLEATPISSPEVMDPTAPFDVIMSLISASTGIPQRVLTGSASGELAAAKEDTRQWAQFIAERQENYAEPEILRPFINMLVKAGVLPEPSSGPTAYDVGELDQDGNFTWPSLIELDELEQADAMSKKAEAVKSLVNPSTLELPITLDEQRELLGYPPSVAPLDEDMFKDLSALGIALHNFREGKITSENLAQFAISLMADLDPLEAREGLPYRSVNLGGRQVWAGIDDELGGNVSYVGKEDDEQA